MVEHPALNGKVQSSSLWQLTMAKRILLISYHTCPLSSKEGKETGGMNVYVLELGKQLARDGYLVDVITRSHDHHNGKIVPVSKNFRVVHLTAGPDKPVSKKILPGYIPQFVNSFLNFAAKEKISYDIFDAHYFQSGIIALEINKKIRTQTPIVMTFHTLALMKNLVARTRAEQESTLRIDSEFNLIQKADAIISPSLRDSQYLKYLYQAPAEKIYEIPPGVNTEFFKPLGKLAAKKKIEANPKEKMVLFVGRIEPLKGIDALLYALKIISVKDPHFPVALWIVGGDISQHLRRRKRGLLAQFDQLKDTLRTQVPIHFIGKKPQSSLPKYYNAADLVVMPSHYESFGMVAAEAMACGTPVITTNVTGISKLVDERRAALITSVNNPLLLANQITTLLTNKDLYRQASKNGLENVKDLHWDKVVKDREIVYSKLLTK